MAFLSLVLAVPIARSRMHPPRRCQACLSTFSLISHIVLTLHCLVRPTNHRLLYRKQCSIFNTGLQPRMLFSTRPNLISSSAMNQFPFCIRTVHFHAPLQSKEKPSPSVPHARRLYAVLPVFCRRALPYLTPDGKRKKQHKPVKNGN